MNTSHSGVTVVVPTVNRGCYVRDTLHDLIAQDYRPLEILVVDQSPRDDGLLLELCAAHPDLISYYRVRFLGLPLARNYGWQYARHEAIVFVDDDIRCGPSLVREHMRALGRSGVGVVGGGIDELTPRRRRPPRPGRFNRWTASPGRGFESTGECAVSHVPGGNFSAWRPVLQQTGGFDEALASGAALYEETEFCLRAAACGWEISFNGLARVHHLAAGSGGCRVDGVSHYVRGLAHNRAFLICRHLRWFHTPTAVARLFFLAMGYVLHYREPAALMAAFRGFREGLRESRMPPVCTRHAGRASAPEVHV